MDTLMQDLRYALRGLRRSPGFAAVAVLTLALGIGASTAMFSLVNSVLLRPLSYAEPDRLVTLWERPPQEPEFDNPTSPANFTAWRQQATSFDALAALWDLPLNLTGDGEPEEVYARLSSGNYFEVLGARARYGRTYTTADETGNVVVLSHRLWQARYGGDPSVLGRSINLGLRAEPATVIGIMPPAFRPVGAADPQLWAPFEIPPDFRGRFLRVIGRLKPGATVEQADTEMRTIAARLALEFPEFNTKWSADVVPLHEQVTGDVRPALLVLLGAVGLLLIIACANLANLLLSRAATRRKELAVRLSLGATRSRLVRQTLTEALVLAGVAGLVGGLLAAWGLELLVRLVPSELALPRLDEIGIDLRVVGFALAISLFTAALFGAAPALAGSAVQLGEALGDAARGSTGGQHRLRRGLVVIEVALAVVLLAGAGLLGRSLGNLLRTDTGMRAEHVLTMRMRIAAGADGNADALRSFVGELLPRLEALPGASAVGGIIWLPLSGSKTANSYTIVGRPAPPPGEEPGADIRTIAGDYHRALGIPVLGGRTFDARDQENALQVVVINKALAEQAFPGEDPLGKRLFISMGDGFEGAIVGVVGNVRESGLDQEPAPAIYSPYRQLPDDLLNIVIRTSGDPTALASTAVAAVREIDPNQPVAEIRSMEQLVSNEVARPRFNLILLGGFAAASLLLAGLGLFGLVSYSVAQRRQEIGVRVALGARTPDVLRLIVGEGMRLTFVGLLIGLGAAAALTRIMASLLYGVTPTDPVTLGAVSFLLVWVALAASWLPARRATRMDPARVLRAE